jgi:TIR domain
MSRDYNRFRVLYSLYEKHYATQFEWQDTSSLQSEEDLRYIPKKSYYGDIVYLQRKGFIEGPSASNSSKVRISGNGIDVIDQIVNEYFRYLRQISDDESQYEYRHLSAIGDDDDALRSQMYYYIKQRKNVFTQFLLLSNIFRQMTFPNTNKIAYSLSESRNDLNGRNEITKNEDINKSGNRWDAFISHASEDKDTVARPLYDFLKYKGLDVWYDEFTLKVGDSLRKSIDLGLSKSVCGIVILSKNFFSKNWPEQELNGLYARATSTSKKIILPVWHTVTKQDVLDYSPMLADLVALSTNNGIENIAKELESEIRKLKIS